MENEQKLEQLFAAYRQACPETEASVNFMPNLWSKIDARRKSDAGIWRWMNAMASVAAAVVMVLGLMVYQHPQPMPQRAYIEKLTDEISEDHFLDASYVAQVKPVKYGGGGR